MDEAPEVHKFVRVDPSDPTRCQGIGGNGEQCPFQATPNGFGGYTTGCTLHMGASQAAKFKKNVKKLYDVQVYRGRIDRLSDNEIAGTLTEELGILRMSLETLLQKATEVELVTQSGQISVLVRDIRDTLVADKKLKSAMGQLLDKAVLDRLCDSLIVIMGKHLPPQVLDQVTVEVGEAIAKAVAGRFGE